MRPLPLPTPRGSEAGPRLLVIAAHPDDEAIGAGARLACTRDAHVACVTDGAPRAMHDASALGVASREAYASLRRVERAAALALAGVDASRVYDLGRVDQESAFDLVGIAESLAALIGRVRPDTVITHPFEGGHPDHDATAFATHAALALLARDGARLPTLVEMSSYHACASGMATCCFLGDCTTVVDEPLDEEHATLRRAMFDAYRSQSRVLAQFDARREPLRIAPRYRFDERPHDGTLWYERFNWGMTFDRWRTLAAAAARRLDLPQLVA